MQKNANQLQTLEQEKEHWILETQLLQMKLEKQVSAIAACMSCQISYHPIRKFLFQKQQNTNQDKTVERHRTLSVSLAPLDSSMVS